MRERWPGLAVALLSITIVAAMFLNPPPPYTSANEPAVTADVKALTSTLGQLKGHADAGRAQSAQRTLAAVEDGWLALRAGLAARGLADSPASLAFEQALAEVKSAGEQDRDAAARGVQALGASFSRVRAELEGTVAVDASRLSRVAAGALLAWLLLVFAIPRVADRMALKQ